MRNVPSIPSNVYYSSRTHNSVFQDLVLALSCLWVTRAEMRNSEPNEFKTTTHLFDQQPALLPRFSLHLDISPQRRLLHLDSRLPILNLSQQPRSKRNPLPPLLNPPTTLLNPLQQPFHDAHVL